jgi:iron complex transport system ATP-binding protein
VQIARALMPNPRLLILDEPAAGLDLGARETLIAALDGLAADPGVAAIVLISHHLEEIPAGIGSALLLSAGRVVAHGVIGDVLADGPLSDAYGQALMVERRDGRFGARGAPVREASDPGIRAPDGPAGRGHTAGGHFAGGPRTDGRS